ncbi:hypothetical protein [Desulfosporosinus youngiae]|uniref:Uncharacterized protein n=1 Tax=Desulfosporosinus youngiae DSM 17734 TaxID=768710 RepID=H5Y245_9FIRM|nr:hypothetical protein [Desulfosporosinus youngiae]EHQ88243.1 hypothetical protein DesyoDRAFT_1072 [Desulfosporosinus youngiae DSM 17734]
MSNQLAVFQLPDIKRNGDTFGQLERVEAMINVTKDLYQISLPKADKPAEYGIMAPGYAKMNQVVNVSFVGVQVLENTRDIVSVIVGGIYYNASGERVQETDVVTLNFPLLHEAMRLKAKDLKGHYVWENKQKKWVNYQECSTEIIYQDGKPVFTLKLDPEIEMNIYQKILHLREMGVKKAITVAKNRIIKRATGVFKVELPWEMHIVTKDDYGTKAVLKEEVHIPVVGYRSPATNSQVEAAIKQLFGGKQGAKDITPVMDQDVQEDILHEVNTDIHVDPDLDEMLHVEDQVEDTEQESKISCEGDDCGRVIESTEKFTDEAIASFSKRKYNKVLCLECQKKATKKGAK